MAESINDIAIKLSVDAAGVSRGFRTAAEETRAYKKVIDEFTYAVEKGFERKFGPILDEALNAQSLAKVQQDQAEFNAWYTEEMDRVTNEYIASEQLKELATQERIANERQAMMNAANASRFQTQPAAETLARAQELDNLEDAIRRRYALLNQAEQQDRDNASNQAEIQRVVNMQSQQAAEQAETIRQQDYDNLKAYYAQLEQAGIDSANRQETINNYNAQRRSERIAQAVPEAETLDRAMELDSLEAAIRARYALQDQEEQQRTYNATVNEANRIIQRNMTTQERYSAQLRELTRIYQTYNVATGQALLTEQQFTRAKTALTIQTIRQQQAIVATNRANAFGMGGYGGVAMAMGQMSYAAEDLIQVLSMGGGLNMALMSASNNLSMVVRALLPATGFMGALAGVAVPALLIGTGSLISYLLREEQQARSTADALRELKDAVDSLYSAKEQALEQRFLLEDIEALDSITSATQKLKESDRDRLRLLLEQQKIEETIAKLREDIAGKVGTNVPIDPMLKEIADQIATGNPDMPQQDINALVSEKTAELRDAYLQLQNALATGSDEQVMQLANRYKDILEQYTFMNGAFSGEFTDAAYERVAALLKEEDALKALRDAYGDEATNQQAILDNEAAILALEQQRQQLSEEMARTTAEAQAAYKEELLFLSRATEAEKAILELKKEQDRFLGAAAMGVMGMSGGPMDILMQQAMMQQNQKDSIAFLQAQKDLILKEMRDAATTTAQGGLMQNTGDAQASAFAEIMKASSRKPDKQLERQIQLLESIDRAINNGGVIQVVP